MRLETVTLTGADDAVDPFALTDLIAKFPFVEFGILLSAERAGTQPRYPSREWVAHLLEWADFVHAERNRRLPLAAHLCGSFAAEIIDERFYPGWYPDWSAGLLSKQFRRIQLNLRPTNISTLDLNDLDEKEQSGEIILRIAEDFSIHGLADYAARYNAGEKYGRFSILFDRSGGTGLLPDGWPEADPRIRCGYAGGLNTENLGDQLIKIANVAGEGRVWVDLETGVRDAEDRFDLGQARRILEAAQPWISPTP